ncbi:tRNA (adenosine(37)-N6)-dimethylallyltransferase MiaA [Candidatus Hydrogenedentota bacterium]
MGPAKTIVVCGPTASGKTSASIHLAQAVDGEIVSADSMQIYCGMDIGTAKPTPDERRQVPHHLIDIRKPDEPYSAADFVRDADAAITDIRQRAKQAIIVGGSGMYIRSLVRGIFEGPPASDEIRARLKERAGKDGVEALHQELAACDPEAAAKINPNDLRRITRALEVFEFTGAPISTLQKQWEEQSDASDYIVIGLRMPREELYDRINQRVTDMFNAGLIKEVSSLVESGYRDALLKLRALGYVETIDHIEGKTDLNKTIELIRRNTRRFAKRQGTWFRGEKDLTWVGVGRGDSAEDVARRVLEVVASPGS